MPKSKKPLLRYRTIDKCLRNTGRKYFIYDILDAVNEVLAEANYETISKRQLYKDLNYMEIDFKSPIERIMEHGMVYFRYDDPNYGFQNRPMTPDEMERINEAIWVLNQFANVPGLNWANELSNKLEISKHPEQTQQIIHFDANPYLRGINWLGPLFQYIRNEQVLDIGYKTFTGNQTKVHRLHPYYLKEYNDRWYLLSYYPYRKDLLTLGIDRIENINTVEEQYILNTKYDFDEYFEDVIGITKTKDSIAEYIELKFTKDKTPFVINKALHGSQKKGKSDSEGTVFSYELVINEELIMLINSFIPHVTVIKPLKLRNEILTRLRNTISLSE